MSLFPLDRFLKRRVRYGRLTVIEAGGRSHTFGDGRAGPAVTIRFHDPLLPLKLAKNPDLAVGEAYVDGLWTLEQGTLPDFFEVALGGQDDSPGTQESRRRLRRKIATLARTAAMINPVGKSVRNVQHHYDIDHRLYATFLDADMQYSCAYFRDETDSIEEAQENKKRHIAKKLVLRPGMKVLDIGSGWGGLALHLAKEFDVHVTGLTLSANQFETSLRRAEEAGLSGRVTFKLLDYRQEGGTYDRIVSVGMFEHVGKPQFSTFFRQLRRLLADDGVALVHTIAKMWDPGPINRWMEKYIFPGSYLPALSELAPVLEQFQFWLTDLETWRVHYGLTLDAWNTRFQANRDTIRSMFDERFCRMWELYLLGCREAFLHQDLCVFQLQLAKRIDAVPLTRDYMYEQAAAAEEARPLMRAGAA
jgi:cyclopropane-fatty-acyl-phospholipid synthase